MCVYMCARVATELVLFRILTSVLACYNIRVVPTVIPNTKLLFEGFDENGVKVEP